MWVRSDNLSRPVCTSRCSAALLVGLKGERIAGTVEMPRVLLTRFYLSDGIG